jgi:hypothetical protein
MKKITLFLALCAISFAVISQETETTYYRPLQGNKTISFNLAGINVMALNSVVNPLNNTIMLDLRYFYKDNLAFRLGFGVKNLGFTSKAASDSTGGQNLIESDIESSSSGYSFGLGVEKHIKTKSKTLDPFIGGGVIISTIGEVDSIVKTKTTMPDHDYVDSKIETIKPGAFVVAVQVSVGFFWYFSQNLALGGELAFGYAGGSIGGDLEVTNSTTSSNNGTVTSTVSKSKTNQEINFSALQTTNNGAIILLVKF